MTCHFEGPQLIICYVQQLKLVRKPVLKKPTKKKKVHDQAQKQSELEESRSVSRR